MASVAYVLPPTPIGMGRAPSVSFGDTVASKMPGTGGDSPVGVSGEVYRASRKG